MMYFPYNTKTKGLIAPHGGYAISKLQDVFLIQQEDTYKNNLHEEP